MKKGTLLHSELSYVISKMGHTDLLGIGDSGLPIPPQVQRIDLAVTKGLPGFLPVLEAVLAEQQVEKVTIALETKEVSPELFQGMMDLLQQCEQQQGKKIQVELVSHETFKETSYGCRAIVRTGEATPYANIILHAGVTF